MTLLDSGTPQAWANAYGSTHPVLEVTPAQAWVFWENLGNVGLYPSFKLMGVDMVVYKQSPDWGAEPSDWDNFLPG
ncbi:MAG: hypothetical protein B7733_26380 [Myxococcales bacterium FL481]|nr:MAG: hypothetical protein B7733_26380 [Myxococcales bacterium FL481]